MENGHTTVVVRHDHRLIGEGRINSYVPDKVVFFRSVDGTNGLLGQPAVVQVSVREGGYVRYDVTEVLAGGLVGIKSIKQLANGLPILHEFAGNQMSWIGGENMRRKVIAVHWDTKEVSTYPGTFSSQEADDYVKKLKAGYSDKRWYFQIVAPGEVERVKP
jgi:hypothetical protein